MNTAYSATQDAIARETARRGERARKFRAAERHSSRVRFLRYAIPAFVVLVLGSMAIAAFFNPFKMLARLPIDPSKINISGTRITMEAPRLAGFTRDARAYEVSASAASQDITKPDLLELKDIRAKVELQNNGTIEMKAANGLYNRKIDQLSLTESIVITSSAGYEGRLTQALVDVKKGSIVSDNPVEVKLLNGTLNANRLEVDDKGESVRFEGGVVMNLMLDGSQKAPTQ
jgi:lipopolysaccharide export system protein LptC